MTISTYPSPSHYPSPSPSNLSKRSTPSTRSTRSTGSTPSKQSKQSKHSLHCRQNDKLNVFVSPDNGFVVFIFHKTPIAIMKVTETLDGEIAASIKLQTGGFKTLSTLLALNKILQGTRFTILQDVSNIRQWYLCYDEVGVEFTEEMKVGIHFDEILQVFENFQDKKIIDMGCF